FFFVVSAISHGPGVWLIPSSLVVLAELADAAYSNLDPAAAVERVVDGFLVALARLIPGLADAIDNGRSSVVAPDDDEVHGGQLHIREEGQPRESDLHRQGSESGNPCLAQAVPPGSWQKI